MGAAQRNKGAAFERWVAKELTEELGLHTPLRRNLEQYQTANCSDIVLPPFQIECKRYASNGAGTWYRDNWWAQVCSAIEEDYMPALVYKYDRHPVRWVFPIVAINEDWGCTESRFEPVALTWSGGLMLIAEWLDDETANLT